jgi:hypothetical protein
MGGGMLNRNRVLTLTAILICLGIGLFVLPRDRVTKANLERIKKGMTVTEVEEILGRGTLYPAKCDANYLSLAWEGAELQIIVSFYGPEQRVFLYGGYSPESNCSFLGRLRSWLGW